MLKDRQSFQSRSEYALVKACLEVLAEAVATAQHAERRERALKVLANPQNYVQPLARALLATFDLTLVTVNASGEDCSVTDGDLLAIVRDNFNNWQW